MKPSLNGLFKAITAAGGKMVNLFAPRRPRFSHPNGKGWPLTGKNRAQRQRLRDGIAAMR